MPKFKYTAKNANGDTVSADIEAFDRTGLIKQLQNQGLFVLSIEETTVAIPRGKTAPKAPSPKNKRYHHKKIKLQDLLTFARQMTTMLESGVTLLRSLEVITGQVESEELYRVLTRVTQNVEQGHSLSESLAEHPKIFNQFWVSLIEVGEASGTMPMVLEKLSFYLEQQASFRSAITSSLMYPLVLFFVCIGAIAFFALFVGPRFQSIFNSMGVKLPLITRVLLGSFRVIKQNFLLMVGIIGAVIFFLVNWTKTPLGRRQKERLFYGLPVVGNVYKLIVIERFTSQMAILVDSGVPILQALDISQRLVNNMTCAEVIGDIKESVRQGELLVAPMERSQFFPGMAIQMITVGEETGELSKMLKHVANYYEETVSTFMKRLGTLIEPFMLVFMGAVIGTIVLAMFLPMFNIAQLAGG